MLDVPANMLTDVVGDIILEDPGTFSFADLLDVDLRSRVEPLPSRLTWLRDMKFVPSDIPRE